MFLTISSNRHIKALVFKIALKQMSKQPKVDKDGRKKSKYDPLVSVERKTSTIKTTRTKIAKKSIKCSFK